MQTTSALWKSLWASGNARLEAVAVIAGTTYTEITAPVINRAVMQNGLSIGNAVSATCRFTVRTTNTIPKSAQVQIKMRLTDGTQTSEWLPAGTFYVSHRTRDAVTGLITLECYDALLKANAEMPAYMPWTTRGGQIMTTQSGEWLYLSAAYPRSMTAVAADLARTIGVEIDSRTVIKTGAAYMIEKPENGRTINDVLGQIAAANGGNWIITPEGKLRLVQVVSSAGAAAATENVVDVDGIVGGIQTSRTGTISGIRYMVDGAETVVGDESGIVIQADVTAAVAADLAGDMIGMTYQSYSLTGAVYDPAAELGDYVRAGANGEVQALLCAEVANLGLAYRGDLSAPELGELADEYPYIGTAQKTLDLAMGYADNAAAAAAQTLNNTLTQQEIFDRLTDGGLTQGISLEEVSTPALGASTPKRIYLNVDYVNDGEMEFDRLRGGTLILGGANDINGKLQVLDADGNVVCLLNEEGAQISDGSIVSYSADKLERVYLNIGQFALQYYGTNPGSGQEMWLDTASLSKGANNVSLSVPYNALSLYGANGVSISNYQITTNRSEITLDYGTLDLRTAITNLTLNGSQIELFNGNGGTKAVLNSSGFVVTGTKSRAASAGQYSERLLYCYETPSPMFGDVGEGMIGEDGLCYISIDPVFAQTISTDQYQVFLQKYDDGDAWVKERKSDYFIVQGNPGLTFGWEIKAKQKDFDQRRLDVYRQDVYKEKTDYADMAAQYIDQIKQGRIQE